jgi:hypothetical protein
MKSCWTLNVMFWFGVRLVGWLDIFERLVGGGRWDVGSWRWGWIGDGKLMR